MTGSRTKKIHRTAAFGTRSLAFTGLMAAMSFIAYEFFRIPNVFGTGASFHLGNTFTALTAMLLDGLSGGLAGAIGLSMADILAGDPGYAVSTFVLKLIIGLVCGFFAHRVFRIKDLSPKSTPRVQYLIRVTGSAMSGLLVNVVTDPVVGYFRDRYLFQQIIYRDADTEIRVSLPQFVDVVPLVHVINHVHEREQARFFGIAEQEPRRPLCQLIKDTVVHISGSRAG